MALLMLILIMMAILILWSIILDDEASVYENTLRDKGNQHNDQHYLAVNIKGSEKNINGYWSKAAYLL